MNAHKVNVLLFIVILLFALFPVVIADQVNSNASNVSYSTLKELPELDMTGLHTDIELIEVDPEITNATTDWIILAHDAAGKKALIDDIDSSDLTTVGKTDTKNAVRKLWDTYPTKFEAAGEKSIDIIVQSDGSNRTMSIPIGHVTRISFDKDKIRQVSKDNNNVRLMKAVQTGGESAIVLSDTENMTVKNITGLRAKKIVATPVKSSNPPTTGSSRSSSSPGNSFSSGLSSSSSFTSDSSFPSSAGEERRDSGTGLMAWDYGWDPTLPDTNLQKAIGHNS